MKQLEIMYIVYSYTRILSFMYVCCIMYIVRPLFQHIKLKFVSSFYWTKILREADPKKIADIYEGGGPFFPLRKCIYGYLLKIER